MKEKKRWFAYTISFIGVILIVTALLMIIIDPYFHFHGPIHGITYRMYSERYMNDGIVRHFDYDAIITGSSMNQNFKTTTMDELYDTISVKVPFSGAGFQEISRLLDRALSYNKNVKYVLWGIDYNGLNREYDWQGYDVYPEYLYDNNLLNDDAYIWNKTIIYEALLKDISLTLQGEAQTTFDEYSAWDVGSGWEQIHKTYRRSDEILPMEDGLSPWYENIVRENIQNNIVSLVNKYPDTRFLLFYTPYSALYWESIVRNGTFFKQLEAEEIASKLLLSCPNISLYSFSKMTDVTGNINNYRDKEHYVADVNDQILSWIHDGQGKVTLENYQDLIAWEKKYYSQYDYDILYEGFEQYR